MQAPLNKRRNTGYGHTSVKQHFLPRNNACFPQAIEYLKQQKVLDQKNGGMPRYMSGIGYAPQQGAEGRKSTVRSNNRINALLKGTKYELSANESKPSVKQSTKKHQEKASFGGDVTNMFAKLHGRSTGLCSATTASTFEPSSAQKTARASTRSSVRRMKNFTKDLDSACKLGTKRRPQLDTQTLELGSQLASLPSEKITLRDTESGVVKEFALFEEETLKKFHANQKVSNFDMSALEAEYDYNTDDNQVQNAHRNLKSELFQAVEFFVKEEPLALFENALV